MNTAARAPKEQGLLQIRKKGLRDMGASLSSEQAHSIAMGAETLALRVAKCSENALALAQFLEQHEAIGRVFYPGLKSHPQYEIAQALFKGASWLLSFELRNAGSHDRRRQRAAIAGQGDGSRRHAHADHSRRADDLLRSRPGSAQVDGHFGRHAAACPRASRISTI